MTALEFASFNNHQNIIELFKEKEREINLFIGACSEGHIEVVRELIERGADINAKNNYKRRRDKEILH